MALDKLMGVGRLGSLLEIDLPVYDTMDGYLGYIIPKVKSWGEDFREEKHYINKRWKELRDNDDFVENVLHFFNTGNEYLISIDGNISKGSWRYLSQSNCMILEFGKSTELYDLAFMNGDFFILKKAGDQKAKGQKQHFVMILEKSGGKYTWREAMDALFNIYRGNITFSFTVLAVVLLMALIIAFSFL